MKTPRFHYDRGRGTTLSVSPRKYSKWIRVSHISDPLFRDSAGPGKKKIFAIVTLSISAELGRKPVRRILIFDNHPDSLRLIFERPPKPDVDLAAGRLHPTGGLAARRHTSPLYVILGLIAILTLVLGMVWPLIVS
jgi:hypothetical protein